MVEERRQLETLPPKCATVPRFLAPVVTQKKTKRLAEMRMNDQR